MSKREEMNEIKAKRSEQTAVTGLVRARDRLRLALTYINQKVRTLLIHALSKGQPSRVYVFHKKKSQNNFESHLEQMTVSLFPKDGTLQWSRHFSLLWDSNSFQYRQRESRTNAQLSASVWLAQWCYTWTSTKIIATAQNIREQKYKIVRRIEGCSRDDQMSNKTKEWTDRETDRVVSAKI